MKYDVVYEGFDGSLSLKQYYGAFSKEFGRIRHVLSTGMECPFSISVLYIERRRISILQSEEC